MPLSPRGRYQKGRRLEYKTMRFFEASEHDCYRMAGSHSPFDVIALSNHGIILAQVKGGSAKVTPEERVKILQAKAPENAVRMVVTWRDRATLPDLEVIHE